jgi:hypothetical protein
VVEFLFARSVPTAEVVDRIRHDAALTEPVRAKALDLAELHGRSRVVREAERQVESLFAKWLLRPVVVESLRRDAALAEPVRRQALALAEHAREDPDGLNWASWLAIRQPDLEPAAYWLAVRQSEEACRLVPRSWRYLTGLGMARYRFGQYQAAVDALTQAVDVRASLQLGPRPADLGFLALSRHRLGQTNQARADLVRLRELLKTPGLLYDAQDHAFLREAEMIELDLVFPSNPLAP